MGGAYLGGQNIRFYDLDCKSTNWWKKVIFRILLICVVNAWIICQELRGKKCSLLDFLVPLAEALIDEGKSETKFLRKVEVGMSIMR